MSEIVIQTDLDLPNPRSGKVRDLYDISLPNGEDGLLIVSTDRISAFDVVLANGLPGKGIVLTQISRFWFDYFSDKVAHHLVSTDTLDIVGITDDQRDMLKGRVMLCRKTKVVPIECIARGYIAGSGWKEYQATGQICGVELPEGLVNGDCLEEPLFTPSTKADVGDHDVNISYEEGAAVVGRDVMVGLRDTTLDIYSTARDYALDRGIILADTKFEFGSVDGHEVPLLIDEILTPDSSRFWPAAQWKPGIEQESFDKQFVRNYLETVVADGTWNKTPPGPELPPKVLEDTMSRYLEAYERLTGSSLVL